MSEKHSSDHQESLQETANLTWQSNGPLDIQFYLLFDDALPADALIAYLPCQCKNTDTMAAVPHEFLSILLCIPRLSASNTSKLEQLGFVKLRLNHLDTWVEVSGTCVAFDKQTSTVQFEFADAGSMQARMILQLVKICQMKAAINQNIDAKANSPGDRVNDKLNAQSNIKFAAKCWSSEFAADFAAKFDSENK